MAQHHVKHARIGSGISSPVPASQARYIETPGVGRKLSVVPSGGAAGATGAGGGGGKLDHLTDPKSPGMGDLKRRRSTFKGVASTLMVGRRNTRCSMDKEMVAAAAANKPKVRMENTYRMSPEKDQQFSSCKATPVIRDILESMLANQPYNPVKAPTMAAVISERIKSAVKSLHCDRYKIVVSVVVSPSSEQGMVIASRCVWDPSLDTSATVSYSNGKIYAIATAYAVYYE